MDEFPYRSFVVGRALLVAWTGAPTLASVDRIYEEVQAAGERSGRKVLYLGIVSPTTPLPNPVVRRAFSDGLAAMGSQCERIDIVVEGDDLRMTLIRTLLRTMTTLARTGKMSTYSSVRAALDAWQQAGIETRVIRREYERLVTTKKVA